MADSPLAGRGVVVTRPREQAAALCALIEGAGGRAIPFPTIEIAPLEPAELPDSALRTIATLESFDLAVFVSANAVRHALRLIASRRPGWRWPASLRAAAVGGATARALRAAGAGDVIFPPERTDSEGLLALPELHALAGRRVAIFRGEGGRPVLGETLKRRGAQVSYCACYERRLPDADPAPLLARWRHGEIHAVTVSSAEGLTNLHRLLGEAASPLLAATPVFVPHPRVAGAAQKLGLQSFCADGPDDAEMLRALVCILRRRQVS